LATFDAYRGSIDMVGEGRHTTDGQYRRPHSAYRAYLVRLWQDSAEGPWRALARDAESGEEHRFVTTEQLFLFLHRQTQGRGPRAQEDVSPTMMESGVQGEP
jgi:hypothetical protein